MEHEGRCGGNNANAYTSDMDFHNASKFVKLTYPLKTISSKETRQKIGWCWMMLNLMLLGLIMFSIRAV
ncbi:hypothetical protein [Butyrivibrio sp. JL13D10]|uniref:hypothetical protein n=1 Tax=Butyrivibrio sp. JL13D10 TaxID=3236815 RepID=UPI0038B58615